MGHSLNITRFVSAIVLFTTALLLVATTLHHVFASSGADATDSRFSKRSADYGDGRYDRSYPVRAERPYYYFPRQEAPFQNVTTTSSPLVTTSSSTPAAPFGVYVTTIDGAPYTLTYVSTTATADTTIVESDATTTTTEDVTAGAPIWAIPTLPPGFPPIPPPGPPPGAPALAGGAILGCLFGCGGGGPPGLPCVIDCGSDGDPGDDPSNEPSQSQDPSSSSQSTSSSDTSSSSSSSSTTTSSSDTTSTTTSSTTTSSSTTTTTSSSSERRCSYGCSDCGFRRRAEPTPEPVLDEDSFERMLNFARANAVHVGEDERDLTSKRDDDPAEHSVQRSVSLKAALTPEPRRFSKRNIPSEATSGGIAGLYGEVQEIAVVVPHAAINAGEGGPSSEMVTWDASDHAILVGGLVGCTSVVVVSRKAGYVSHFWETPSFTFTDPSYFQSGVLDHLQSSLGGVGDVFSQDAQTKIYIMTPAARSHDLEVGDNDDSTVGQDLEDPDPDFTGKIGQIVSLLGNLVPGAPVEYFYYARQWDSTKRDRGAYGKAFITYSGSQNEDPDTTDEWEPAKSVWQVYMQAKKMGEDVWDNQCSGNQKRQDNGSCGATTSSTPTSTPTTTSTASPTTTSTSTLPTTSTSISTSTPSSTPTSTPTTPSTTPTSSSSTPPPPPSCQTKTANGAVCTLCDGSVDPACSPIGPPTPSQTSSNNKGSALCKSAISGDDCKAAYSRYDDNRIYTAYTSYTFTNSDSDINYFLGPFADDGCTAIFKCDNDNAYATGMAGWQIKQAFDYLYANDNVKTCGSAYLSNSCHVTVNGCQDCKDVNA